MSAQIIRSDFEEDIPKEHVGTAEEVRKVRISAVLVDQLAIQNRQKVSLSSINES